MTETKFQRLPFLQATDPPKIITVYRNGDAKNPGRKLVLNEKRVLSWEAFLDNVTDRLKPTFGAVRRLTTPHGSRKVGRTVDVEDGGHYVATGSEKFCHLP